ncbi:MAG: agmatine deiminase family protein [Rhodospirillaceae bacterium]
MKTPTTSATRPKDDGFFMPPEWCRHARTWTTWPACSDASVNSELKDTLSEIIQSVREFEPITVVATKGSYDDVANRCGPKLDIITIPHDSPRIRDTGPTFLVDGKGGSAAVDWKFNSWGQNDQGNESDSKLTHTLLGEAEVRRFRAPLTLESGIFCSDDNGTLIVSSAAIFDSKRNPNLSRLDAFNILTSWLGVRHVIWCDQTLGKDVWKSELRRSCVFARSGHALVGKSSDDDMAGPLDLTAQHLAQSEDARGARLTVERIPVVSLPEGIATYTTFYVLNEAVLLPKYGAPEDDVALSLIQPYFAGRKIIQINCIPLLRVNCSLSSLLQYQPARLLERHKATLLPKSAWHRPVPDYEGLLDSYIERLENGD